MNEVEKESNRQNPDWPVHPLPFGRGKHPDYPIRHGVPAMDRCICGGVRHWHASTPYGCDDCSCEDFTLDENWRPPVTQLYKWMLPNNRTSYQNKAWPVEVGEWTPEEVPVICRSGWHGCEEKDVLAHLPAGVGATLWVVETRGSLVHAADKFAAPQMRLVREVGVTTERNLRLFAADCAENALPIFEQYHPNDTRPRRAIEVARDFANGKATAQERDAARNAAWDAAWAAAGAAAGDAAWAAAGDAAGTAAWAAAGDAAGDAAWAAAGDAAGAAAWAAAWAAAGAAARYAAYAANDAAWAAARDAAWELYSNWLVVRLESDR